MALSILDGNQSATTLSTIVTSGQHIPAHTIVSFGTQAKTDILSAVSSGIAISGTVTANTRSYGLANDPWVYIPSLTINVNNFGNATFDGYYRFNGENQWGIPDQAFGNCAYIVRTKPSDGYEFRLMLHDEANDVEIECAIASNATSDIPNAWDEIHNGTLVSGSLAIKTEQRESYGVRITNSVTIGNSVTASISGTVTIGSIPNGTLTTRFGSITTANTAFSTTAVTNTSRKYLMIQNIASTVITAGIGFTPTTTQGIQLVAGATITYDGNYIPTGAVRILSSVTASNFTVLEA